MSCLSCLGGWSRRAVLCAAAGVLVGAQAATKKTPPPKAAAARQWRVALRVVRGGQVSDLPGSVHYRSDVQAQPAQMELVVAEGETARWAVSQTQRWVWTDAVWSGSEGSAGAGTGTAGFSSAGPGSGTQEALAAGTGRGGVVQSPHKSSQTQWLECEVLAQTSGQGQKVRLRVLWQEPRVGAGESVVSEEAAVALDQMLWLVPDTWQTLAQTGSGGAAANPNGARHWGTRSTDTPGAPWQLQLRLERVTP